nr:hypothetical protein [Nocardia bovistercoris]
MSLFALSALFGGAACTVDGPGSKADCHIDGCTITFQRGVDAKAGVLGIEAKLVAVNGNIVTLEVAGKQVSVPVGETQPADGMNVTVTEVTEDQVVVRIATGVTTN